MPLNKSTRRITLRGVRLLTCDVEDVLSGSLESVFTKLAHWRRQYGDDEAANLHVHLEGPDYENADTVVLTGDRLETEEEFQRRRAKVRSAQRRAKSGTVRKRGR